MMRSLSGAFLLVLLSCFSIHLAAQTAVELRWDFTTGDGSAGSNKIAAEIGDQMSLLVVVKDKSAAGIGLLGAALSVSYDTKYLEHIRFHECPNPPNNKQSGACNDLLGTLFEPYVPGLFVSAGWAYNFDAYSVNNKAGYFNNNGDEMTLGRLNFKVIGEVTSPTDVVSIFYDDVSGEFIVDGHNVLWQPKANAAMLPPPSGC